jgi:hypothetical protein
LVDRSGVYRLPNYSYLRFGKAGVTELSRN